jgi:hypothetical protein
MAEAAADYHPGDQDISEQVVSYRLFRTLAKWAALHIAVLIVVLTLWFCVGVTFLSGLIPGLVILALGIWFLRPKPAQNH